jgi:hypothetical protein
MSAIYNPNSTISSQSVNTTANTTANTPGFANTTISSILKTKEQKILADLENVKENYLNGLKASNIDISSDEAILTNLIKIIQYSVVFVETNGLTISKMVFTDLTSGFKLTTCVNLVMDVVESLFPKNYIVSYIENLVAILFPKSSTTAAITATTTTSAVVQTPSLNTVETAAETPLQKNGSLKKGFKYVLNRSGCIPTSTNQSS